MNKQIQLHLVTGDPIWKEHIELPSSCPLCHTALIPQVLYATALENEPDQIDDAVLFNYCPECNECFISYHTRNIDSDIFECTRSYPQTVQQTQWGEIIEQVSPSFVEIYSQSDTAEKSGLNQIAGVGFRKALEFLIKDYLISLTTDPNEISKIKKKFLGKCIEDDIDNPQLKLVASRAAWLGNDQTHYEQRFNDRDISDLKRMIRLTVHWISLIKETEEAQNITPQK